MRSRYCLCQKCNFQRWDIFVPPLKCNFSQIIYINFKIYIEIRLFWGGTIVSHHQNWINLIYFLNSECGRTYQANSATFSSPGYLSPTYNLPEDGERCEWRITATHGERIILNITELDITKSQECKSDYLEIRDGYWHRSQLLGRYCGFGRVTEPIVSTGSRMLLTLVLKSAGHKGFIANYEGMSRIYLGH